jgi:broad specificity phosphatase PhoE
MNRVSQVGGQLPGDGLDAMGFKQRVGIFLLLKDEPYRAVFSSDLLRARQTAEPLARHRGLPLRSSPDLNEFHGGVSEGICYSLLGKTPMNPDAQSCDQPTKDPLVRKAEDFLRAEDKRRFGVGLGFRWPGGGESILDVDRRLKRFLAGIPQSLRDQAVVVVGHSGTNRFLLANLMGWKLEDALRIRQGNTQVFRVERRAAGTPPLLQVYTRGSWIACPEPATMAGGLPCLARPRRPRPDPPSEGAGERPRAQAED